MLSPFFSSLYFTHFILFFDKSKYLIWNAGTRFSDYFVMKLLMEVNVVIFFEADFHLIIYCYWYIRLGHPLWKRKNGKLSYKRSRFLGIQKYPPELIFSLKLCECDLISATSLSKSYCVVRNLPFLVIRWKMIELD